MTRIDSFSCEIVQSIDEIKKLLHEWQDLLTQSTCNRAFLSFDWFVNALQEFRMQPFVCLARKKGILKGILPLAVADIKESKDNTFLLTYPQVQLTDAIDLIVAKEDVQTAKALLKTALLYKDPSIALFFRDVRKNSNVLRGAAVLEEDESLNVVHSLKVRAPVPIVDTSQGWQNYLFTKSSNFRRSMNRSFQKLEKEKMTIQVLSKDSSEISDVVNNFLRLHFQSMGDQSLFFPESAQRFVVKTFPQLIQSGVMVALLLKDSSGETHGVYLDVLGGRQELISYQHGYNTQLPHLSLGWTLCAEAIRRACESKALEYSLGRTTNEMKDRLKSREEKTFVLVLKNKIRRNSKKILDLKGSMGPSFEHSGLRKKR